MQIYLKNAQTKVDEMVKDSQLSLLHYKEFGTDEIKKICTFFPFDLPLSSFISM